jgi:integrase
MAAKLEKTRHPGIYKRGSRYVVVWRYRGKQHKSFHHTLAEAREAKGQRQAGDRRPRVRVNVAAYFEQWIDTYGGRTERGFTETTRTEYRRLIERHVLDRWRAWTLGEIERADVRRLFSDLRADGVGGPTLRKLRTALSSMFESAVEDGAVRANPIHGVRIPPPPDGRREAKRKARPLTRAELGLLLGALPEKWRLFFELLAHSGLRISEAIALRWEHVDLGTRPRLRVEERVYRGRRGRTKSEKSEREVPLSEGLAERLRELRRDSYRGEKSPVFASPTGRELHPSNVSCRVLKPAAIAAGLLRPTDRWKDPAKPESWVSFHTFRHTCASLLFEAGKSIKQVQEWLGHEDPGFTLRTYVHLMDDGLGDADFLDDVVVVTKPEPVEVAA